MIGRLLMAVPKKRTSYTNKRIRRAGQIRNWLRLHGPKEHIYMCPVCERMRLPHRVCDREDCKTYFAGKGIHLDGFVLWGQVPDISGTSGDDMCVAHGICGSKAFQAFKASEGKSK